MTKIITVVTNPELGWDCVVAVYDHNTSEDAIHAEHGTDVVLHTQMLSTLADEKIVNIIGIETIDEPDDDSLYSLFEDNLQKSRNDRNIMAKGYDAEMTENDQRILLKFFEEFLEEFYPEYKLQGTFVVMRGTSKQYGETKTYYTSRIKFETGEELQDFEEWFYAAPHEQFQNWVNKEKGIELH